MMMTCLIDGYTQRCGIANNVKAGASKNKGRGGKGQKLANKYVPTTATTGVFDRWHVPKQKRHPQSRRA